jgi:hypothetical protein
MYKMQMYKCRIKTTDVHVWTVILFASIYLWISAVSPGESFPIIVKKRLCIFPITELDYRQETKLRPACYLHLNEIGNGTKNANIVVIRHGHKSDLRHQNNNNRKWTPNFQTLIMIHHIHNFEGKTVNIRFSSLFQNHSWGFFLSKKLIHYEKLLIV